MDINRITSKDNPLIKLLSSLQTSAKSRKETGMFVIEGLRICDDACSNGIKFEKLFLSDGFAEKFPDKLALFYDNSFSVYSVADNVFKKIADTDTPQGILALVKTPEIKKVMNRGGRYVALENIQDPANLGAVARTAEALGADGIILQSGCDPYSPKSLRSSMGTLLRIPVFITDNISEFLSSNSLRGYACVVDSGAEKISDITFTDGDAVIIGNEANGITDSLKKSAYKRITIPMYGTAESLNAAAATAIALWELTKNR